MKIFILKISISIAMLFYFVNKSECQIIGCIDSISFNQYFPSYFTADISDANNSFLYMPQRDAFDNVYLSGRTDLGGPNKYWSIIKFNASNQLVWYKNYKTDFLSVFRTGGELHDIESNGNLLFSTSIGNPYKQTISKTDNGGNLLWSKIIKHGTNPILNVGFSKPVMDNNGELFCTGFFTDDIHKPVIMALDATGILKWSKRYQHNTVPKFHLIRTAIIPQSSSTLFLAVQYYYNADIETDPAAKFGLQLVKINKADGSIIQQQAFTYFNDASSTIPNRAVLEKINYDTNSNRILLVFRENYFSMKFIFTLVDSDFNLIKTVHYYGTSAAAGYPKISVDKDNTTVLIKTGSSAVAQNLAYTVVDNQLNIVTQRFIDLINIGFPNRNFTADLAYKKNGILNFELATNTNVAQNYLFLFDNSPFYNNISPCLGVDFPIYSPIPIYVNNAANPTIEEDGTVPLQITDQFPDFPPVNFPLPKTELCKTVSICDTIKLFGTKYHCLSNPIDSFKIYRNPLCVRKTNWQIDTNYIKILSQNDTSLHVQYLQPYRGSIKVGFGGCSLTDTIPIEVYAAQTGVNLGNDTMHCPGKTITLKAGQNFRTYLWQDGSSKDSLVAAQPGMYNVIATDSCGNIFKDTVTVNPFDVVLKTDYPKLLCPGDTALFNLPNQLINYTWLPTTNSSLNGFTWRLYPTSTTTYSISGQRLPGCTVSDTVLINVKPNCLPDYMYFPTAFTPDNNGINDTYKPGFNGQLVVYEFIIYNRYGQPVFISSDPSKGWDGRFKNSSRPLTGSYVWMCKYQFAGRPVQQEQGTFTLIR